jgi:hypothetical protein
MSETITLPLATVKKALVALENSSPDQYPEDAGVFYDAKDALRAALEQPNECHWYQDGDEDSNIYMASCNRRYFELEDGAPTDNHMKHCCYCGKPLVEVPIEPEDNHE